MQPGRSQVNIVLSRKQEHSWKPEQAYQIIESCSPGPYLELFARQRRTGWVCWGNQAATYEKSRPRIPTYNSHAVKNGAGDELFQELES